MSPSKRIAGRETLFSLHVDESNFDLFHQVQLPIEAGIELSAAGRGSVGYQVVKLDRVFFAGLTKKDLPRGRWRHLSDKEVVFLTKRR